VNPSWSRFLTNELEVAREIREYAGHQLPTIEYLEIARKIVKKVRGWEA
jgi:hypothetical protein